MEQQKALSLKHLWQRKLNTPRVADLHTLKLSAISFRVLTGDSNASTAKIVHHLDLIPLKDPSLHQHFMRLHGPAKNQREASGSRFEVRTCARPQEFEGRAATRRIFTGLLDTLNKRANGTFGRSVDTTTSTTRHEAGQEENASDDAHALAALASFQANWKQ